MWERNRSAKCIVLIHHYHCHNCHNHLQYLPHYHFYPLTLSTTTIINITTTIPPSSQLPLPLFPLLLSQPFPHHYHHHQHHHHYYHCHYHHQYYNHHYHILLTITTTSVIIGTQVCEWEELCKGLVRLNSCHTAWFENCEALKSRETPGFL